jgi:DNA-binding NarL/FixJ family response regulator
MLALRSVAVMDAPSNRVRQTSGSDHVQLPTPTLAEPAIHLIEADPLVLVIGEPSLLQRRILAALDFDRLRVVRPCACPIAADPADAPPIVAVVGADDDEDALVRLEDVRRDLPRARVVLVLERIQGALLRRALRGGATAAIPASGVETGLALAVRGAAAGLVIVPEGLRDPLDPPDLSSRGRLDGDPDPAAARPE